MMASPGAAQLRKFGAARAEIAARSGELDRSSRAPPRLPSLLGMPFAMRNLAAATPVDR